MTNLPYLPTTHRGNTTSALPAVMPGVKEQLLPIINGLLGATAFNLRTPAQNHDQSEPSRWNELLIVGILADLPVGAGRGVNGFTSRTKGQRKAFELLDLAERRRRRLNNYCLLPVVQADAQFIDGVQVDRDDDHDSEGSCLIMPDDPQQITTTHS